jgi:hypothetical protein
MSWLQQDSVAVLIDPSLIMPGSAVITDLTLVSAMYAVYRTILLAIFTIWAVVKRTRQELFILGVLADCMQFLDGLIGPYQHDTGKTIGPFVLASLQFVVLKMRYRKEVA